MLAQYDIEQDRRLWRAVIIRAVLDATEPGTAPEDRAEAIEWLTEPSEQFDDVCALAGLEPDRVRAQATAAVQRRRIHRSGKPVSTSGKPRGRQLTFNGRTMNMRAWAIVLGIDERTLAARFRKGWSVERALSEPTHATRPGRGRVRNFSHSAWDRRGSIAQDSA